VVQSLATGCMIGGIESQQRLGIFLFTTVSRPPLRPTQPPVQWVQGALSLRVMRPRREATTHLHLVAWSRMRRTVLALFQYAFVASCSIKAQGQLYLHKHTTPLQSIKNCQFLSLFIFLSYFNPAINYVLSSFLVTFFSRVTYFIDART
jgi:hypothetical protein